MVLACVAATTSAAASTEEEDKTAAQEQFAEGQRAYAAGDYARAAEAFEEAYRRKPHHSPLWNAARSRQRAGESARAANLYTRYLREAPPGTRDRDQAIQSLRELSVKLGKIVVHGLDATDLRVDDVVVDPEGVYVPAGEHVITGAFGAERAQRVVTVVANQELSVTLERNPKKAASEKVVPIEPPSGLRLPWPVVAAGGALTLVAAGFTVWSGLDTLDKRKAFDERFRAGDATQDQLDDGRMRQLRTNVLVGVTAGLAVVTGVAALFVDWGGERSRGAITIGPTASATSGGVLLGGRLP